MNEPLYKRIGCPPYLLQVDAIVASVEQALNSEDRDDIAPYRRTDAVVLADLAAIQHYILGETEKARTWGKRVLEFAEEYFFGDWRERIPSGNYGKDPPDRSFWDRRASWQWQFETCLLWGGVLDEWERLRRFASYLQDDIIRDAEQSKENRAWLLIVAGVLLNRPLSAMEDHVATIRDGSKKRENLLLDFLEAIASGTDESLAEASKAYFKHYKASESKKADTRAKVSVYGTFLVNFGRHRGRAVPVPKNVIDHIVSL